MVKCDIYLTTKILNLLAIAAIVFISVKRLVEIDTNGIRSAVLSIYYLLFAVLIICTEFKISFVQKLFGFLTGQFGKGMFLTFCGTLFLKGNFDLEMALGIFIIIAGIFNILLVCKHVQSKQGQSSEAYKDSKGPNTVPQLQKDKDAEKAEKASNKA